MKLIAKLIAGILAGVIFGFLAPEWFLRTLLTVKVLIGEMINFTIPLIILFFITSGIASLPQNSGKLLGKTVGLAYASTIVAGTVAFLIASQVIPLLTPVTESVAHNVVKLEPFMQMSIPPLFGVMTALATAFLFGIGISKTQNVTLKSASDGGRDIIDGLLAKVIIPLLPLYIAGVFAEMTLDGTVFSTLKTFGIVLVLAISMHWLWLTVLYVAAGLVSGRSPLFLLRTMLPAYFT
ncbi:MAG: cation:dicarboxylate symporter family transporter, partial [Plesiomonas sp.]